MAGPWAGLSREQPTDASCDSPVDTSIRVRDLRSHPVRSPGTDHKRRWAQDSVRVRPQAPRGRCAFLAIETGRGLLPAHALAGEHENNSRLRGRLMSQANGRTAAPQLQHQPKPPHSPSLNTSLKILPSFRKAFIWGHQHFLTQTNSYPNIYSQIKASSLQPGRTQMIATPTNTLRTAAQTRRKPLLTQFQDFFFTTFS